MNQTWFKKIKEYKQKRIKVKERRIKEEICERAQRSNLCNRECGNCAWEN